MKCQAAEVLTIISSRGHLFICCKGGFHSRAVGFYFTLPLQEMLAAHATLPFQCVQATFPAKLTTAVPAWLGGFPAPLPRRTCGPSELAKEKQGKYSEVGVFVCLVRCNGRKGSHEFPVFHFLLLLCITYICFPDQPL